MAKFKEVAGVTLGGGMVVALLCFALYLVDFWREDSAMGWDRVPCVIEKFEITTDFTHREPFKVEAAYRYEAAGKTWTGNRWYIFGDRSENYEEINDRLFELTGETPHLGTDLQGRILTCRVHPHDPSRAVLLPNRTNFFLMIGLASGGILFVGSLIFLARRCGPVGQSRPGLFGAFFMFTFFSLSFLGGIAVNARDWWGMGKWVEAPGKVIGSGVETKGSRRKGTSARARVRFEYQYDGRTYRASRYNVLEAYGSTRREEILGLRANYPIGKAIMVFVDPEKPWHAVVDRSGGQTAAFAILPSLTLMVGAVGLRWTLRGGSPDKTKRKAKRDRKRS